MLQFLNQMLKLPLSAFVFGMEMFVQTMQGMQRLAEQGIDAMLGGVAQTLGEPSRQGSDLQDTEPPVVTDGVVEDDADKTPKEENKMSDNSLSNDRVKVVEYYILSIRPDYEHILPNFPKVKVFTDTMTPEDFAAWVIAEYFQEHPHAVEPEYKKFVRVCYEVICTFDKQEADYDKEQIQVLKEIARRIGPAVVPVRTD